MEIRIDYDELEAIAQQFMRRAEHNQQLANSILDQVENLRAGGWIGVGANAFYREMDDLVLPALRHLTTALHETHSIIMHVIGVYQDMEDDAAHLFLDNGSDEAPSHHHTTIPAGSVSAQQYRSLIDNMNVEGNPRYVKFRDGDPNTYDTYCNLFAADVAAKMGAPLPLYVTNEHGKVTKWLGATNMKEWLDGTLSVPGSYTQGPQNGWVKVDTATAIDYANNGYFTVVAGHGHMAVVRPGNTSGVGMGDVIIAQAGEHNFNEGPLKKGWGPYVNEASFYVHIPQQ